MAEINNGEDYERWLVGKSYDVSIALANRIAMRVFPFAVIASTKNLPRYEPLYSVLRALVSSAATVYSPILATQLYSSFAASADTAAIYSDAESSAAYAAFSASSAASYASSSPNKSVVAAAESAIFASNAVEALESSYSDVVGISEIWRSIRLDVSLVDDGCSAFDLLCHPLWCDDNPVLVLWVNGKKLLRESGENFSFLIDWYERVLEGRPQNWEMLEEIALIDPEDWDQGAEHVNGLISEIQIKYLLNATQIAEKIGVHDDTGLVYFEPIEVANPEILRVTLDRVSDALDDALTGGNGLTERSYETTVLRRLMKKYSNDPQRVEMDLFDVHRSLEVQIGNEYPDTPELVGLANTCRTGALDIRANNPDIAEARDQRAKQFVKELSSEDIQVIEDAEPVLAEIIEQEGFESFEEDVQTLRAIRDQGPIPFPDGATPLAALDASARIANRVTKIGLMQRSSGMLEKLEKNPLYRGARITLVLGKLWDIFKFLFF